MIPARMCLESLDRRPGIRGQLGSKAIMAIPKRDFRSTPTSVHWPSAKVVRLVPEAARTSYAALFVVGRCSGHHATERAADCDPPRRLNFVFPIDPLMALLSRPDLAGFFR
jgi:hypothetical protein